MEQLAKVTVNGRIYQVAMFDPAAAFVFCHELTRARTLGKSVVPFGLQAIHQCVTPTPECKSLGEEGAFQAWFSQYPDDMLPLELAAVDALIAPFMPPKDKEAEGAA